MNKTTTFFLAILITIAVFYVCRYCSPKTEVITATEHISDTIFIERVDTIVDTFRVMVREKVLDTIYIDAKDKDSILLPITQRHYSNGTNYDLWISGYTPKLDSINIYNTIIEKTIENTTTKTLKSNKALELYVFGGLNAFRGDFIPKVGISLKAKKEWLITTEIGLYNNKPVYGISLGKNINF